MLTHLVVLLALPAHAQEEPPGASAESGIDAHGFVLASHDGDPRDPLTIPRPGAFHGGDVFGTMLIEWADSPLVQVIQGTSETAGEPQKHKALDDLLALNISAGVAVHDQVRLDAYAPVYFMSRGLDNEGTLAGPAPGDPRVSVTVVPIRPVHVEGGGGLGVGVTGHIDIPVGTPERFLGRTGPAGGWTVSTTYEVEGFTATGAVGMQFDPKQTALENLNGADTFNAAGALGFMFDQDAGATAEIHTALPFDPNEIAGVGTPSEVLLSYRQHLDSGPHITFGAAAGISQGAGAAMYRVFVGMGAGKVEDPRPRDTDPLAAFEVLDKCPDEAETANGWKDDDGCPDKLGALEVIATWDGKPVDGAQIHVSGPDGVERDETSSGSAIAIDAVPGSQWSGTARHEAACLSGAATVRAAESSTELNIAMKPVWDAHVIVQVQGPSGEALPGGTFAMMSDQASCIPYNSFLIDGFTPVDHGAGTHTVRVDVPGYKVGTKQETWTHGETKTLVFKLEPSLVVMEKTQIRILDKIHFEFNKAIIKPESFGLLNEVAAVIITHPDIGRVEVGGHTDDKGSDSYNLDLSQRRSESVRQYLIGQGVPEAQLLAVGYGETKPIDTNKSEKGRAANRRVEFKLIDQKEEEPAPTPAPP